MSDESQTGPQNENEDQAELKARLAGLREEHRDLDEAIAALVASGARDQIQLTRLKKRKLQLKDLIARVEDELLPDIIA
ncbi:MAG TPA: DUF465 domain-containing protein [Rhizomicrobium sp.]|nr:DUF465 domain-containing protein [Rhizomicrobium sp.]